MYRALILKELRDLRGVLAVAAFVGTLITATLGGIPIVPFMLGQQRDAPVVRFTSTDEVQWLTILTVASALALGYWQSIVEIQRGTALYLFHRPLSRRAIIRTKLAVGLALQSLVVAIPILLLGILAGWPGLWPAPFSWNMTWGCWAWGAWSLLVYLGASASGWFDARWSGMRLAPLAAVVPLLMIPVAAQYNVWWMVLLPPCAGLLLVAVLYAADSRDY